MLEATLKIQQRLEKVEKQPGKQKKKYSCVKFLWQGQLISPLGEAMLGTAPPGPVGKALLKGEKRVQGACSKEPRVGTPP